jgi:hypothetical protein
MSAERGSAARLVEVRLTNGVVRGFVCCRGRCLMGEGVRVCEGREMVLRGEDADIHTACTYPWAAHDFLRH